MDGIGFEDSMIVAISRSKLVGVTESTVGTSDVIEQRMLVFVNGESRVSNG